VRLLIACACWLCAPADCARLLGALNCAHSQH